MRIALRPPMAYDSRMKLRNFAPALLGLTALTLTGCAETATEIVDPTTGTSVDGNDQNKSGKPPTVVLPPAQVEDDEAYGDFGAGDFKEVNLKLSSGKVVTCVLNTYNATIDTCDWANPVKASIQR